MVDFIDAKIREYILKHDLNDEASNLIKDAIKYILEDDNVKWKIFNDYERYLHKEDILNEIDYIHNRDNTNIIINDEKLEDILLQYEDNLANSEDCARKQREEYDNKDKTIADLEAKLADKSQKIATLGDNYARLDEKYDFLQSAHEAVVEESLRYEKEIEQLKQQLAEKEKEIDRLREINLDVPIKQMQFHHNQDKISFCIEKLEKVKGKIQHNILFVDCDDYVNVIEQIDNQIGEVKKEMR